MKSSRISVPAEDTARVDFLLDSVSAGHCLRCGGRAHLINHGRSIHMEHRCGCPEIPAAECEAQLPSTFRSNP